jgi:hypothetical protein
VNDEKFLVKSVLNDILRGFSVFDYYGTDLYIKHFTLIDNAEIDNQSNYYYKLAKSSKLETYDEKYAQALKDKTWSTEKEKALNDEKLFYSNLLKTKQKFFLSGDIEQITEDLEKSIVKIQQLEFERASSIGPTIENYVDNRVREISVIKSLYKDPKYQKRFIPPKKEKDLEKNELLELINGYNLEMNKFTRLNIKKAALNENYLSPFCMCDVDPHKFYGRAVIELTTLQMDIFIYAAKYKSIISDWKDIPAELLDDPEKLEEESDKRDNIKKVIESNRGKGGNLMIPGVSNSDMKKYGLGSSGIDADKLIQEAKKRGGTLSFEDGIRAGAI